ncbi:MAG TPA: cation transporting ATPase C-terminal domain-containing protein, partial [Syntrophales bacterium]
MTFPNIYSMTLRFALLTSDLSAHVLLPRHATPERFRTGWFMESVISAAIIVLVIRSRRPFFKRRPGKYLSVATIAVVIATLIFPFTSIGTLFGFESLHLSFLMMMALIV